MADSGSEDQNHQVENRRERARSGDDLLQDYHAMMKRDRTEQKSKLEYDAKKLEYDGKKVEVEERSKPGLSNSTLLDAARAAGLELPTSNTDPMSSISALLAAAQATGGLPPSSSAPPTSSTTSGAQSNPANQGLDLSNPAAAMANVNVRKLFKIFLYLKLLISKANDVCCLGPDAAVLLHAEAAECRDGKPEGEEGVSDLRENTVRQINMEQTHADSHW